MRLEEAKLTKKQRKSLSGKSFCGPDRSFPVPDCNHVQAALSLIGKYKGPGSKSAIRTCIYRKAKRLGCFKTSEYTDTLVLHELLAMYNDGMLSKDDILSVFIDRFQGLNNITDIQSQRMLLLITQDKIKEAIDILEEYAGIGTECEDYDINDV